MIRVILIDDHPMFRIGVAHYLSGTGHIEIVGQADDGLSGLHIAENVAWDVAVVDISLPKLGGTEVVRRLRAAFPGCHVVVLSHFPSAAFEAHLREVGAHAFVSKVSPPEALVSAIEAAAAGKPWLGQETVRPGTPTERFTGREHQVFLGLIQGRSTIEIAAELDIAASTVSNHIAQIKQKLGVTTVAGVIASAHRMGMLA